MTITARKPAHRISISEREEYRSPLRYPGGKQRGAKRIADLFPASCKHIASPFLGGGSVELELASRGHQVKASEIFSPAAAFWQQVSTRDGRVALHATASEYVPCMSKHQFYQLQSNLRQALAQGSGSTLELATMFFVINRSSFSGATLSGGMASGDRFSQSAVDRILTLNCQGLTAKKGDYWEQLFASRASRAVRYDGIYADPPYCLEINKLYGDKGSTHDSFDHEAFADRMNLCRRQGVRIVISYNDCATVRQLFAGWEFRSISWAYGMNASKQSNEVLITDLEGE